MKYQVTQIRHVKHTRTIEVEADSIEAAKQLASMNNTVYFNIIPDEGCEFQVTSAFDQDQMYELYSDGLRRLNAVRPEVKWFLYDVKRTKDSQIQLPKSSYGASIQVSCFIDGIAFKVPSFKVVKDKEIDDYPHRYIDFYDDGGNPNWAEFTQAKYIVFALKDEWRIVAFDNILDLYHRIEVQPPVKPGDKLNPSNNYIQRVNKSVSLLLSKHWLKDNGYALDKTEKYMFE
jgi:hypothetical protein